MRRFHPLLLLSAIAFPAEVTTAAAEVDDTNHGIRAEAIQQLSLEEMNGSALGGGLPGGARYRSLTPERALVREWSKD
ncbi:hypothetical protein KM176_01740 [Pseudooceanicola sp. CBS1P-1]|uniref:Uncharacterized protein n=1 Tax=Pseudooceanicola albus TaxID=2692189 RepID=A0A6L7G0S0_9RHOB|nr:MULTISPECIES: hypothetical protein [Pseudooceanicola]MBT9382569.1 hypothetical protein [Pseudooceanicola endophyticus]MXN17110.1 hypothetical protein [Pseudooceanicola albus]